MGQSSDRIWIQLELRKLTVLSVLRYCINPSLSVVFSLGVGLTIAASCTSWISVIIIITTVLLSEIMKVEQRPATWSQC